MHNLRFILISLLFISFHILAKAQQPPSSQTDEVVLIEDKQPKRWLMYAQNNSEEEQEVFLMVQGTGFRRSADRPIIKRVPANSKVLMMTLIPLKGVEPVYSKIFTYETNLQQIKRRKGEKDEEYVNIRPLKDDELTVFIEEDCEKCDYLLQFLNTNHINYRRLDLGVNPKVKDFMFGHLRKATYKGGIIDLPAIMYQGRKHWSINNIQQFVKEYDWGALSKS